MNKTDIVKWLKETNDEKLEQLWHKANEVRKQNVGDDVHLRGLLEISNHCSRSCGYCGIRAGNKKIRRYRMSQDEIITQAKQIQELGYGTVVMQAGEDSELTGAYISDVIMAIKSTTDLAITLSLGEKNNDDLLRWKNVGADRYLLRFETSNSDLFKAIHPPKSQIPVNRFSMLSELRTLGYEIGSGVMIGIPGQSYETLAQDLQWFSKLNLDMIGVGPFIPHPNTPLGSNKRSRNSNNRSQVPATEKMTYKVVALSRIICPQANIPSTTALASLNPESGREIGLERGANVIMPNCTPLQYRKKYEIYPAKACIRESQCDFHRHILNSIKILGRKTGKGPGPRKKI